MHEIGGVTKLIPSRLFSHEKQGHAGEASGATNRYAKGGHLICILYSASAVGPGVDM